MIKKSEGKKVEIKAKDFIHHDRNLFWYVGIGVLIVGFLVLTISLKDYLLTVVVVVSAVAVFRLAGLKPSNKKVEISDKGVKWGSSFIGYHNFRAFWIDPHKNEYVVHLERLNLKPTVNFVLNDKSLEPALNVLIDNLPFHIHRNTPLPDRLSRMLRL